MDRGVRGNRVLIVEDSALMRGLLAQMLTVDGFEVLEAADGRQALSILSSSAIDMVLSDRRMQPMSGLDLLHAMRADPALAHIPFILFSGDISPQAIAEDLTAGVCGRLVKPFDRKALRRQMDLARRVA